MFAESAQDTLGQIQAVNQTLNAMKPNKSTPTRKISKNIRLKLFETEDAAARTGEDTSKKRRKSSTILRSRNAVVDAWLNEEDEGMDTYADLEDFLVY